MTALGEFDKRITFQSPTRTDSTVGGFTVTWTDVVTVWAKMTTHRSDEAVQAMANSGSSIHNFRIHYREDIKSSWRIKYGTRYMNIIGPPIEVNQGIGGRYLDITAQEVSK